LLILLILIRAAVNIFKVGIIQQLIDLWVNLADVTHSSCQEVVLVDLLSQGPQELRLRVHHRVRGGEGGSLEWLLVRCGCLRGWVRMSGVQRELMLEGVREGLREWKLSVGITWLINRLRLSKLLISLAWRHLRVRPLLVLLVFTLIRVIILE
jgi:hypothetical protein